MVGRTDPRRLDPDRRLRRLAFDQAGYFTQRQVAEIGFTIELVCERLAEGSWRRVERDLFRLPEWPHSETEEYARWCLWCSGVGVISHHSAATLHGLGNLRPSFVHLIAPVGVRRRAAGVVLHHAELTAGETERADSFTITTPLRTAVDLVASDIAQRELDAVIRDGLVAEAFTIDAMRSWAYERSPRVAQRMDLAISVA